MLQVRLISVTYQKIFTIFFSTVNVLFFFVVVPDEKSWKAEAEIDMELFHQVDYGYIFIYNHNTVPNKLCI